MRQTRFRGWWITLAAFFTFGFSVGIPYYSMPFFYDYYQKEFGWQRSDITLGFPLAALATLWVGPFLVHRFSPRRLIMIGTALTCIAFLGFGTMDSLGVYYVLWFFYMIGYIFSGPIPHQVLMSQWFRKKRGVAMAIAYLGVGIFGACSSKFIAQPLTEAFGWKTALMVMGGVMFLTWPIAIFIMRDTPAEVGQFPDGASSYEGHTPPPPLDFRYLLRQRAFWLLLVGSTCSIGAIGSINQHMKFIFLDQGFKDQAQLNQVFSDALFFIMISSMFGRIIMGWLADRFPKKYVMLTTYALVAGTIPLLAMVSPTNSPVMFAVLFGFGLGADYMLIPLMAADQFGANSLARVMAIILPTDTIGQTWFPYLVARMREHFGSYSIPLDFVFGLAVVGAAAILMMPRYGPKSENQPRPEQVAARS